MISRRNTKAEVPTSLTYLKAPRFTNAALVRSPDNSQEIESDLKQLCKQILSEADSKKQRC